jgi:abhydrolase domain-containing protein 6
MFDRGIGRPLLVIPGVQGRWEWMRPALHALSRSCRTLSYSLCGDLGSGTRMDPSLGFEVFARQIDGVLAQANLTRVALCGVSFGGAVAARYAARYPERVSSLVLASAPGPSWTPSARQASYIERPWSSVAAFCVTALDRLGAEIYEALPTWPARIGFTFGYLGRALWFPMWPGLMAQRIRLLQQEPNFSGEAVRIQVPTLLVTGEPRLDRVIPVESTREYIGLIPGVRHRMMERTGHLGLVTQPDRFARIVSDFVNASDS